MESEMNETASNNSFYFSNETGTEIEPTSSQSDPPALKQAIDILLIGIVMVIMLSMGCTITLQEIWKHIKAPMSILVGMLSQFVLLPACGFALSLAISLHPHVAIGMLVLSCCPGGTMSNLFTYWLDGDVSLSVAMTTFATIMAFGMMPFNLWLYGRHWTSETLNIPYIKISISLAMILGPVVVGMVINKFKPKIALIISKIGSYIGMLGILASLIMQSILFPDMYSNGWQVWVCATIFPMIGFSSGFIFSKLTRRNWKICKAVAFETGSQNVALAMAVLFLTFPYEILGKATSFPQLYAIIMLTEYGITCAVYNLYMKLRKPKDDEEKKENNDDEKKVPENKATSV